MCSHLDAPPVEIGLGVGILEVERCAEPRGMLGCLRKLRLLGALLGAQLRLRMHVATNRVYALAQSANFLLSTGGFTDVHNAGLPYPTTPNPTKRRLSRLFAQRGT